jgi:hypothetical protein
MNKNLVIMRDVICVHHPRFKSSRDLKQYGLQHPEIFNVERLVEESMAAVGSYAFIDAAHADFSDGSDSKTSSIGSNPLRVGQNSYRGEISNVETAGGGQKQGALRCVIYNPHRDCLMYYFVPKPVWRDLITIHPSTQIGKIMYSYNRAGDYIARFDGLQCSDFEELCYAA